MALPPNPTAAALICLLSLYITDASSLSSDHVVSELSALQSQSPTGVIHLSDALLTRILSLPTPRPFHFLVFFDAQKLHSKAELSLSTLKSEFSLVSSSFLSNNPDDKSLLFFFDVEYEESQASFALFGINSLPHIRLIPPSAADLRTDSIKVNASDYSRLADSMAEFILSRSKLSVGPISRPPVISKKQIIIMTAIVLISIPYIVKKLISGKTIMHKKFIWMAGAILLYFFSVSGAMFNIIKKTPMFLIDRRGPEKMMFFYKGSRMQLGAEVLAVSFLYSIVGLSLPFVVHLLVRVRNVNLQRWLMLLVLLASCWAVYKMVFLNHWKKGYRIHGYWPSKWQ